MKPRDREEELRQAGLDFSSKPHRPSGFQRRAGTPPAPGELAGAEFLRFVGEIDDLENLERFALECSRCHLRSGCKGVVFGEGSPRAQIAFVGEAPGADEDRLGRPFVGRAGKLLDRIIDACGLLRDEVYITNIVKCRPAANRTPTEEERNYCIPYLHAQMRLVRPGVLVSLGAAATQGLIRPDAKITRMRGTWQEWRGIKVMPTFHPAALLRDPRKRPPVWEDMKSVLEELGLRGPA